MEEYVEVICPPHTRLKSQLARDVEWENEGLHPSIRGGSGFVIPLSDGTQLTWLFLRKTVVLFSFCCDYLVWCFRLGGKGYVFYFALIIWKTDYSDKRPHCTMANNTNKDYSKGFMDTWWCTNRKYSVGFLKIVSNQLIYSCNWHFAYLHICMQYYLQVCITCYFYSLSLKSTNRFFTMSAFAL